MIGDWEGLYYLREVQVPNNSDLTPEISDLRTKNTCFWNVNLKISIGVGSQEHIDILGKTFKRCVK